MRARKLRRYRRYGSGDTAAIDAPGYEVFKPARKPEMASDTWVPLAQAVITGLLATNTVVLIWIVYQVDGSWRVLAAAGALFAGLTTLAWMWSVGAVRETWWLVESILGTDLDGDGEVGDPQPAHLVTITSHTEPDVPAIDVAESSEVTPADELKADLVRFVQGCVHDTSTRRWEAQLGRERYIEFREHLMRAGCAAWKHRKDKKQGWTLTRPVDDILRRIV